MSSQTWEEEGDGSTHPIRGYEAQNSDAPRRPPRYLHISLIYIFAFVIIGLTSVYLYFVPVLIIHRIRPYFPIIDITRANISGLSIHDETLITGTFRFEFLFDNPNEWTTIHYYIITSFMYVKDKENDIAIWDFTETKLIDQEKYTVLHLHIPIFLAAAPLVEGDPISSKSHAKLLEKEMSHGELTSLGVGMQIQCLFRTWLVEQLSSFSVTCAPVFNFNSTTRSGQITQSNCYSLAKKQYRTNDKYYGRA